MEKNAHLTFDERQTIEVSLRDNLKFRKIWELLGKNPSTISKEIRNHYKVVKKSTCNPCVNRRICKHYGDICTLILAFIRNTNTARSVTDLFNQLYVILGHEKFTELFPVTITDRGSEFTDPLGIEFNGDSRRRTRVFYGDPQCSNQKGGCEVCHEMIHRVLPRKVSFDDLTQDDVSLLTSYINSYTRKKLNDQSANQLFIYRPLSGSDAAYRKSPSDAQFPHEAVPW